MSKTMKTTLVGSSVLVLAVFLAGFTGGNLESPMQIPMPDMSMAPTVASSPPMAQRESTHNLNGAAQRIMLSERADSIQKNLKPGGLLNLVTAPGYRRAAEFTFRVTDCAKSEDALEVKLEEIKGEILEMVMQGTEGSRRCTISLTVPSDEFRDFVVYVREIGEMQAERITATRLRPGYGRGGDPSGVDPRELSLVTISMADEKVAPEIIESRGVLSKSFDRSTAHLLQGFAVIVEVIGYALPFAVVLTLVFLPIFLATRWRRAQIVRIED